MKLLKALMFTALALVACATVKPGFDAGVTLGQGKNQTKIYRVRQDGRVFLVIEDYDSKGKFRRSVNLIKSGSPADTQRFTPKGMRD